MQKQAYTKFLTRYPSESTRTTYDWALKQFFRSIYKDGSIESQIEDYLNKNPDRQEVQLDLDAFFASTSCPPKSLGTIEGAIRAFLNYVDEYDKRINGRISDRYWKNLKLRIKGLKSKRALTADLIPSANELRRILSHLPIQGKALYLVLSSGGMRIGDALQIRLSNLRLNQSLEDGTIYHEIDVFDKKTGNRRFVFVSNETVETIEGWLRVRETYLRTSSKKCKQRPQYKHEFKGKPVNDDRLFPFSTSNARVMWNLAIEKAGLDMRDGYTNRRKIHPHSLRKFYRTKMAGTGVPVDVVEALMGHEAYLDEYRRYSKQDLVGFYRRGVHALMVYGDTATIQSQLDRHQRALKVFSKIALRQMTQRELNQALERDGVDPGLIDGVVGGGKSIKSEWDPELILEVMELLESTRDK